MCQCVCVDGGWVCVSEFECQCCVFHPFVCGCFILFFFSIAKSDRIFESDRVDEIKSDRVMLKTRSDPNPIVFGSDRVGLFAQPYLKKANGIGEITKQSFTHAAFGYNFIMSQLGV